MWLVEFQTRHVAGYKFISAHAIVSTKQNEYIKLQKYIKLQCKIWKHKIDLYAIAICNGQLRENDICKNVEIDVQYWWIQYVCMCLLSPIKPSYLIAFDVTLTIYMHLKQLYMKQ